MIYITETPQTLVREWCDGTWEPEDEALEWLRSRPDNVKELMLAFPPSCIVRSIPGESHVVPGLGRFGIVSSYVEPGDESPNGQVSVRDLEDAMFERPGILGYCDPKKLEVVSFYKTLTPDYLKSVFAN